MKKRNTKEIFEDIEYLIFFIIFTVLPICLMMIATLSGFALIYYGLEITASYLIAISIFCSVFMIWALANGMVSYGKILSEREHEKR